MEKNPNLMFFTKYYVYEIDNNSDITLLIYQGHVELYTGQKFIVKPIEDYDYLIYTTYIPFDRAKKYFVLKDLKDKYNL